MRNLVTVRMVALATVLALASACAPGDDLKPLSSAEADHDYRLAPNDEVRVTTYGEPTLSGEFGVDQGGNVALPLLGPRAGRWIDRRGIVAPDRGGATGAAFARRAERGDRSHQIPSRLCAGRGAASRALCLSGAHDLPAGWSRWPAASRRAR